MATTDDAQNKAEELKGRGKEAVGSLTNNDDLKNEGKGDQAVACLLYTSDAADE